jgi:hypothetical protein
MGIEYASEAQPLRHKLGVIQLQQGDHILQMLTT